MLSTNRPRFEHELKQLQEDVVNMGHLVNKALNQAVNALTRHDCHLAQFVIDNDKEINRQRFVIEDKALSLIATQQPVVAHDLRLVAAILNITGELERMGDHARGTARINLLMDAHPLLEIPIQFTEMAKINHQMLEEALKAFIREDREAALAVAKMDDEVDNHYDIIFHKLLQIMLSDTTLINGANYLLWVAHNLERFGDRITNICERIIFVSTGQMTEIVPSREDRKTAPGTVTASARQELEG